MNSQTEIELKFLVPRASRPMLTAEMTRGSAVERITLAAMYLDTDDRRLARAGLSWRLRREGRRWIQTLKAAGANSLERFEHEVIRPGPTHDAAQHAGTSVGDRLLALLRETRADGADVGVRFQTEVRRVARRIRTRGAVVEVAFDQGRLLSDQSNQRICEVEFELVSGSAASMLGLAERWRRRFGLIYDPRSKAERGDRLAEGSEFPAVRKGTRPDYSAAANATEAFGSVLDECLSHITRNAIGLAEGDPDLRVEHVHQLRVGIRRLRSALRSFDGWMPSPPATLISDLRALFATLGQSRDSDVLGSGVVAALEKVGAPPLKLPAGADGPDPADQVRSDDTQRLLLAWLSWHTSLPEQPMPACAPAADPPQASDAPSNASTAASTPASAAATLAGDGAPPAANAHTGDGASQPAQTPAKHPSNDAKSFRRNAERRLRRWHRRIVKDWKAFDDLDETSLHSLRKRIKRQRYAVEFFAPVLHRRKMRRYLEPLAAIQDRMGELNDLFVARTRYQSLLESDPAAWFALGWIAARIAEVKALAKPELGELAQVDPPVH